MARRPFQFVRRSWPSLIVLSCVTAQAQDTLQPLPVGAPVVRPLDAESADIGPIDDSEESFAEEDSRGEEGFGHDYESGDERSTEVIRERYPNGAIKIERHITEDASGNLINHGRWTQWDQAGNVIGTGEFDNGLQHGRWVRYLGQGEGKMFAAAPYQQFERPFVSEVTFNAGKIDGAWYVVDARKRRIMQCEFANDQPHGKSTWWYASGQKMREVSYTSGKIDGELLEWSAQNQLTTADTYKEGRKHAVKIEWYSPGKKKSEGPYLFARQITQETYDWWNASVQSKVIGKEGDDQRHGAWVWWYPNGMKKMEGRYADGQPDGKFVWWYQNSQKFIEGEYTAGKQHGRWTWWHANGLTQYRGEYLAGQQTGRWAGYTEEGKLVEVQDFSNPQPSAGRQQAESSDPADIDLSESMPKAVPMRARTANPAGVPGSARRR